ncbi:hypothetical protein MWU61_07500 [Loktanella sp. F6476L]|uniref:hypothetical protein n=1 Tax=Loktanella sp. F6476L TaxID=2926405 RepID=UPI001FF2C5D6|nr:hypothetical protein [Loktanella sp. F6476L]MCK0120381.1 hypothetical protein [Loktanella sp. F6476L]UWQ99179.1 hypothetical protein K3729_17560 [Rhodobacteraceae bacterium S2214]
MKLLKTSLAAACLLSMTVSTAQADNAAVVISDQIGIPEVGPDVVTLAGLAALLAIASAASATSTTN